MNSVRTTLVGKRFSSVVGGVASSSSESSLSSAVLEGRTPGGGELLPAGLGPGGRSLAFCLSCYCYPKCRPTQKKICLCHRLLLRLEDGTSGHCCLLEVDLGQQAQLHSGEWEQAPKLQHCEN